MKVEVEIKDSDDFIKLIPETKEDRDKLNRLGHVPYERILSGGYLDGSVGISLYK